MKRIITFFIPALITIMLISCSSSDNTPVAAGSGKITGIVQLTSTKYSNIGESQGYINLIGEMNGVKVYLMKNGQKVTEATTSNGTYSFTDIAAGTYTVRAVISDKIYSESKEFTLEQDAQKAVNSIVLSDFDSDDNTLSLDMQIPNPFSASLQVFFTYTTPVDVSIDLYDLQGNKAISTINIPSSSELSDKIINTSDLAAGIYFVYLQGGNNYGFSPVVKQ